MFDSGYLQPRMPSLAEISKKMLIISCVETANYSDRMRGKAIKFGATGSFKMYDHKIKMDNFSAVSSFGDLFITHLNNRSLSIFDACPDIDGDTRNCPVMGETKIK